MTILAYVELTITQWPGDGSTPHVIAGPYSSPVTLPDADDGIYHSEGYLSAPTHALPAAQLSVRLSNVHPAQPGWYAANAELISPNGAQIGRMRPVIFYGHRHETGSHIYFPETYDGASFSCQLRVVSGGL